MTMSFSATRTTRTKAHPLRRRADRRDDSVAGWATGSMALLADGFHMATHGRALGVAAFAYSYARRHARDPRFTFGMGKVGDLAGFASALVLAMIALGIGVESAQRLFAPSRIAYTEALGSRCSAYS